MARQERLPGLYRGLGPTLIAIAPFMAVQQSSYDVLKDQAIKRNFEPTASLFFVCGSAAGAMAQTVSNADQLGDKNGQVKNNDFSITICVSLVW